MKSMRQEILPSILRMSVVELLAILVFAGVLGNISALVDHALRPNIDYFDSEHFIVGGITAIVAIGLAIPLRWYALRLRSAQMTINRLEAVLPICSNCKKIRKTGAEPSQQESWQPLDTYLREQTGTEFSHGICPECTRELYPEYSERLKKKANSGPVGQ